MFNKYLFCLIQLFHITAIVLLFPEICGVKVILQTNNRFDILKYSLEIFLVQLRDDMLNVHALGGSLNRNRVVWAKMKVDIRFISLKQAAYCNF
jgi:hypothetical protein